MGNLYQRYGFLNIDSNNLKAVSEAPWRRPPLSPNKNNFILKSNI